MFLLIILAVFSTETGPAPTILEWYGHCVRVSVNKLGGGVWGVLPQENFYN